MSLDHEATSNTARKTHHPLIHCDLKLIIKSKHLDRAPTSQLFCQVSPELGEVSRTKIDMRIPWLLWYAGGGGVPSAEPAMRAEMRAEMRGFSMPSEEE